jgi:hypothetical protein
MITNNFQTLQALTDDSIRCTEKIISINASVNAATLDGCRMLVSISLQSLSSISSRGIVCPELHHLAVASDQNGP